MISFIKNPSEHRVSHAIAEYNFTDKESSPFGIRFPRIARLIFFGIVVFAIGKYAYDSFYSFNPPQTPITLQNAHQIELVETLPYDSAGHFVISPDGKLLAFESNGRVIIYDWRKGKRVGVFNHSKDEVAFDGPNSIQGIA